MTALSTAAIDGLRAAGIDPGLVVAMGLHESETGRLAIPYTRVGGPTTLRALDTGLQTEPDGEWPANRAPGAWWPMGRTGSTVVVVLGASDALFLAGMLFRVGHDGEVYRRPNLPAVLADAVPVALPESTPGLPLEWVIGPEWGIVELITEMIGADPRVVFLTLPRIPTEKQRLTENFVPALDAFVQAFVDECPSCEVLPVVAHLPEHLNWAGLLKPSRGATKVHALAAVLEYCRQIALAATDLPPGARGDPP